MILKYLFSSCGMIFAPSFKSRFSKLLDAMPLSRFEKDIIKHRYIDVVTAAENDYRRTCIMFILLTNIISIAGVFITGLVSLDRLDMISSDASTALFWVVWSLSISLTLSNKWLYSFNIHKKYVLNVTTLEKFYTEGWCFVSGIDRYKNLTDYNARFKLFCTRVERIKMKSLESMPEMESNEAASDILATGTEHPVTATGGNRPIRKSRITTVKSDPTTLEDNIADDGNGDFIDEPADISTSTVHIDLPQPVIPQQPVVTLADLPQPATPQRPE